MEVKGMMDKIGPLGRVHFIGKKCFKFLEQNVQTKSVVSIVPIIGEYKSLSGFGAPELEIGKDKTTTELF